MIGQLLDRRYRIIKVLGSNSFGQTFLAADTHRPGYPQCVVKQLRPPSYNPRTLNILQLLVRKKAETLEKLGKHDQIPQLLAFFEINKDFYLVEEFIAGQSLTTEIVTSLPLAEDQVILLLQEILEILVVIHQHGVIHQEIKPKNLIRRQVDDRLVLINFGTIQEISSQVARSQNKSNSQEILIKDIYQAPEQSQGIVNQNQDIYAVGIIGIQALTGLSATDLAKLQNLTGVETQGILWRHRAQVSPDLADIIDKMIHPNVQERYQAASEVLEELQHLLEPPKILPLMLPVPAVATSLPKPQEFKYKLNFLKSRKLIILAGLVGLILIILGFSLSFNSKHQAKHLKNRGVEKATSGDQQAAIQLYNQAIQLNPNDAEAHYKRGNINYELGNLDAAITDYTKTIQLQPDYANAYYNRGLVYYDQQAYQSAIQDYNQLIKLKPNDSEAYYKRGLVYFTLKNHTQAIEDYTQAIRLNPNDAAAYISRGLALAAAGDKQAALQDYTQAIRLDANNPDAYYSRGRARFFLADYQGAKEDYSEAIKLNPNSSDIYVSRCGATLNLGQYQEAVNDCTQAIQLDDKNGLAYDNRCVAYLNLGQYPQAIKDCTQAISLNSGNSKAYSNRGLARSAAGDHQGSIDDYTKAIQINPSDAVAYSNRAAEYSEINDYGKAIEDFTQAIRLNPDHDGAYYGRGLVRAEMGDKQGAIQDFLKASKLCLDQGNTNCYNLAQSQIKKLQ